MDKHGQWRYISTICARLQMEKNDQLQTSEALPPGKRPTVPTGLEDGWAPEPGWTLQRRDKSALGRTGTWTSSPQSVAILWGLSRLRRARGVHIACMLQLTIIILFLGRIDSLSIDFMYHISVRCRYAFAVPFRVRATSQKPVDVTTKQFELPRFVFILRLVLPCVAASLQTWRHSKYTVMLMIKFNTGFLQHSCDIREIFGFHKI